jgi:integrase
MPRKEFTWNQVTARAPLMAATMARYLDQLSVSARPSTVDAYELALRFVAGHLTTIDSGCVSLAGIERRHIEDHKRWLTARPGKTGKQWSPTTIRHRLCLLRTFFERIIEWGYDDAPARSPIYQGDFPEPDEALPMFLDDPTAAKFMAGLAADPDPRRRLMVELLARTGMRAGELGSLEDDAMVRIGDTHWLRIPVGKLHNDRYVPLHPLLVELITDWLATRGPSRSGRLVERNDGKPYDRRTIHRYVAAVAKRAGVGHVHPHQLRHTLATQAINRGMSLEAIAALLGHRSMRMTLVYARISDRTVADEYFRVTEAVEAGYQRAEPIPADIEGPTCVASPLTTVASSATGTAPGPSRSTAASRRSANAAGSSTPDPSSSPSSAANAIMPSTTTSQTALSSSPNSSAASTTADERGSMTPAQARMDHPCNNTSGTGRRWLRCYG